MGCHGWDSRASLEQNPAKGRGERKQETGYSLFMTSWVICSVHRSVLDAAHSDLFYKLCRSSVHGIKGLFRLLKNTYKTNLYLSLLLGMFYSLTSFNTILSNKNIPTTTVICIRLWWAQ